MEPHKSYHLDGVKITNWIYQMSRAGRLSFPKPEASIP